MVRMQDRASGRRVSGRASPGPALSFTNVSGVVVRIRICACMRACMHTCAACESSRVHACEHRCTRPRFARTHTLKKHTHNAQHEGPICRGPAAALGHVNRPGTVHSFQLNYFFFACSRLEKVPSRRRSGTGIAALASPMLFSSGARVYLEG